MKTKLLFYGELSPRVTGISYMNEIFIKTLKELYYNKIEIRKVVIKHSNISIVQSFFRIREILFQLYYLKNKNIYFCVYNFNLISLINLYLIKLFSSIYNRNIILYVQIHRVDFDKIKYKKLALFIFKKYHVIVLNDFQKEYLSKFEINSIIIRNTLISETVLINRAYSENINFTFLSNYIESKGILLLLQTFKKITNNSVYLTTYGNYFDSNITKLKLKKYESDRIKVCDNLDEMNKAKLFAETSCFILPSLKTEAQSIVVLESMFQGIPIIVSNVGTISDMVGESYDLLVNDISEENLLMAINKFLSYDNNKLHEISLYLKNRYHTYFSRKLYYDNISNLFSLTNNVIFYSSLSNITTGQSIISQSVFNILSTSYNLLSIDTSKYNSKFLNTLSVIYRSFKYSLFFNYNSIYITASRSKYGFLKDYFNLFILFKNSTIIINHIHGINFVKKNEPMIKSYFLKTFFNYTTNIILHNSFSKEYISFPKFNYQIIENFVDPKFQLHKYTKKNNDIVIFYPANIIYSKGINVFLDVAEKLLEYDKRYKFIIAGDFFGDEYYSKSNFRNMFTKRYNNLNKRFPNNIIFVGKINLDEKIEIYSKTTIVLFPTFYRIEAFPLIGLESFASKCIFLTNNHNYLKTVYSNYHVLYTNNDVIDYVNYITDISQNSDYYNSIVENNFNVVYRLNGFSTFKNKILQVFQQ